MALFNGYHGGFDIYGGLSNWHNYNFSNGYGQFDNGFYNHLGLYANSFGFENYFGLNGYNAIDYGINNSLNSNWHGLNLGASLNSCNNFVGFQGASFDTPLNASTSFALPQITNTSVFTSVPEIFQAQPVTLPQPKTLPKQAPLKLPTLIMTPTPVPAPALTPAPTAALVPACVPTTEPIFILPPISLNSLLTPPIHVQPTKSLNQKKSKSGKEAKPTKSTKEKSAPAPAPAPTPAAPTKSVRDLRSPQVKLIEDVLLMQKGDAKKPNSLNLIDVLDFFEWLRQKRRRQNLVKLLDEI